MNRADIRIILIVSTDVTVREGHGRVIKLNRMRAYSISYGKLGATLIHNNLFKHLASKSSVVAQELDDNFFTHISGTNIQCLESAESLIGLRTVEDITSYFR